MVEDEQKVTFEEEKKDDDMTWKDLVKMAAIIGVTFFLGYEYGTKRIVITGIKKF